MTIHETQVAGIKFTYVGDFVKRATIATNTVTGETKAISESGYLSNDLSVRKAISYVFGLKTFRKN